MLSSLTADTQPATSSLRPPALHAGWIWCEQGEDENIWVWARREFSAHTGSRGTLEITADSRYLVWINGHRIGFGPPKFHPETPTLDRYEVSAFLQEGVNVIAAQVYSMGFRPISSFAPRGGALYVRLDIDDHVLESDESWRMMPDPAYERDTLLRGDIQPPVECYDARRSLGDPRETTFQERDWPYASLCHAAHVEKIEPSDIAPMAAECFRPDRIVNYGILRFSRPLSNASLCEWPALMAGASYVPDHRGIICLNCHDENSSAISIHPPNAEEAGYIIWDLGRIWTGYPILTASGIAGTIIDLSYGEHLTDGGVNAAKSGLNYFDRIILGDGLLKHRITWPKCARYLQITIHQGSAELHSIEWERSTYSVVRKGHFFSSDPVLDQAVEISLHTVQLCMEDSYMDTPWRERGSWLGDDLSKCQVGYGYFGDYALARRFLVHHVRGQLDSGMMRGKYPGNVTSHVSTWTLRFPTSVLEYCAESGDWSLAEEFWPHLERVKNWVLSRQLSQGLFFAPPIEVSVTRNFYNFIDWAPTDTRGANAAWNAFAYDCLRSIGLIAQRLGRGLPGHHDLLVEHRRNFVKHFWDDTKGVFVNGLVDDRQTKRWGCHENILASLFDLAEPEQKMRLWKNLIDHDLSVRFFPCDEDYDLEVPEAGKIVTISIARNAYRWPTDRMVPIGTPYFAGYLLQAMSKEGLLPQALSLIKAWWGDFSRQGATTVWETWDNRQSLSHGWSCSPALVAMRQLGGLERLDVFGDEMGIYPFVTLSESFQARTWTRVGFVQAHWKNQVLRVDLPHGLKFSVGLPSTSGATLFCNGHPAPDARPIWRNGTLFASVSLPAGSHQLQYVYEN